MVKEKPVRVIASGKGKHKTETRVFARDIHEDFCVQPGCKFEGEHAVQNVCHTQTTFNGSEDWSYIDAAIRSGEEHVANLKKYCKTKAAYVHRLESELTVAWINTITTLDELVQLRGRIALLEKKRVRITQNSEIADPR